MVKNVDLGGIFLKIFFDVDHFFKSLLSLLQCCFFFKTYFLLKYNCFTVLCQSLPNISVKLLLFYVLIFQPQSIWDLSSLTRNWTCTPSTGRQSINHWTTKVVPESFLKSCGSLTFGSCDLGQVIEPLILTLSVKWESGYTSQGCAKSLQLYASVRPHGL